MLKNNPPIFIYALINPVTNTVFYVGATSNIKKRLSLHKSGRYISKTYKSIQIRNILEAGMEVETLELDVCYGNDIDIRFQEEFYIQLFRSWGFYLPQLSSSKYSRYLSNDLYFRIKHFNSIENAIN